MNPPEVDEAYKRRWEECVELYLAEYLNDMFQNVSYTQFPSRFERPPLIWKAYISHRHKERFGG